MKRSTLSSLCCDNRLLPSIQVERDLRADLPSAFSAGLIEMLMPDASKYPPLEGLHDNFGDPLERVKWRSKQNIDYAVVRLRVRKVSHVIDS